MEEPSRPNWLERLSAFLMREPEDSEQLLELLRGAFERHLMDADALSIIEGALSVADMAVRDVMVGGEWRIRDGRHAAEVAGHVFQDQLSAVSLLKLRRS